MVLIYFSELNTTIDASTLATFDPTATTNLTGRTYGTDVDLTCTAANARALMKFNTDGADVTDENVTGVWTNTAGAISGAGGYSDGAAVDYVQELSNLVFGNKSFVDLFDNEADVDTDYKTKYNLCVSQLNYGGGAASDGATDATNNAAALAAVKGILTDATARKRFELQYNMAPNTTFTTNTACDVFRYNTVNSSYDTTKLANFSLNVTMTDTTTIGTITRGTINTTDHTLVATDKFMIVNPKTGETLVQTITQDFASILNNLSGTLTNVFSVLDFGFGASATDVTLATAQGSGADGKVNVTCDSQGYITSIVAANHSSEHGGYAAGNDLTFTQNGRTVTLTDITADMASDLNAVGSEGTNNMLSVSDARFSTTAMTVTGGDGAARISLDVAGGDGIPTGATISTPGASYASGSNITLTNTGTAANSISITLTFSNAEVVAQMNGVGITSDVKEAAATTNGKTSPYFTTATDLPVTDPTGTQAGSGSGALVNVEMTGNDVTQVSLHTSSAGTGYLTTGRMVVHNYTDGTVAISGGATPVLMNDIQKAMLNLDVNSGVVALTSVPVPFEANDILYARIDITTPAGQTNASAETPTAFTQKSIVKITLT